MKPTCWFKPGSVALVAMLAAGLTHRAAEGGPLSVAVAVPDVEAIVKAVGGDQVSTFSLFKGCILRKDLGVETPAKARLAKADVLVWTGFLNESAAVNACLTEPGRPPKEKAASLTWIDVSKGAKRVNVPTSTCQGYIDPSRMEGDPFFWLNPENGAVVARNVAEGLGDLRPAKRPYFLANADSFKSALEKDIARWKEALKPLAGLRIFSTQCGWQNFSQIGGPTFVVCKGTPGVLPTPALLVEHVKEMKAQVIFLDPNTPSEYGKAFREQPNLKVMEVPSSIEFIPGAKTYSALFDNLVKALQEAAKK